MGHAGRRVRNGKVIYRVRYRGPDGRERSRNFKRKVDAGNYLTTVESAKLAGTWTDPMHGKMTFAAWLEAWWETAADLRPSTKARDRSYFNSMVLPRFGTTPWPPSSSETCRPGWPTYAPAALPPPPSSRPTSCSGGP